MSIDQVSLYFVCVFVSSIAASSISRVENPVGNIINLFNLQENVINTAEKEAILKDERKCDCGPHSTSCSFDSTGKQICKCSKGYGIKVYVSGGDQTCEECDCGTNGILCVRNKEKKLCKCKLGDITRSIITTTHGKCKECDCGPKSKSCKFDNDGKILCKCVEDYVSERVSKSNEDEYCKPCDCGENGTCEAENSRKVCKCLFGFAQIDGKCQECDCGGEKASTSCTINPFAGYRKCDCKKGYLSKEASTWDNEYCERCDCGEFSESCEWFLGYRKCTCKEGYVRSDEFGKNDYCEKAALLSGYWIAVIAIIASGFLGVIAGSIYRRWRSRMG